MYQKSHSWVELMRHWFFGIGIELELTFLKTKGIGIQSGIDKKELEWNLELIKSNWPQLCIGGHLDFYWISLIFHVKLPMSLEVTRLNFSFPPIIKMSPTRRLHFFFSEIPWNLIYSCFQSLQVLLVTVLSVFKWDWKRGCDSHFGFNQF